MQRNRPTSVLVIAIFHFIFGGFGLLCDVCGGASMASGMNGQFNTAGASETPQQKEMREFQEALQRRTEQELPLQKPLAYVNLGLSVLLSLLLIVGGFGLVQMRDWGWWASILYGVLAILVATYSLLFNVLYNMPISQRILSEELPKYPGLQPMAWAFQFATLVSIIVPLAGLIYPIIVLIVLSRPSVRAAFRGAAPAAPDRDDLPRAEGGYGDLPLGYGGEPDDRIGPAPR